MTLHPMEPGAVWGDESADGIEPMRNGWRHLLSGVDLWRLVDPARADQVEAVLERAIAAGPDAHPWLLPEDVEDLVRLLFGLEDALQEGGVMDEHWFVQLDRVPDLASRVAAMDAGPERSESARRQSLAEVLVDVTAVRAFLAEALMEGCSVVLD